MTGAYYGGSDLEENSQHPLDGGVVRVSKNIALSASLLTQTVDSLERYAAFHFTPEATRQLTD